MTVNRYLRIVAGLMILVTLGLGHWVHEGWYLFTAFIGLNLLQSGFTDWCPMMSILKILGVPMCSHEEGAGDRP